MFATCALKHQFQRLSVILDKASLVKLTLTFMPYVLPFSPGSLFLPPAIWGIWSSVLPNFYLLMVPCSRSPLSLRISRFLGLEQSSFSSSSS